MYLNDYKKTHLSTNTQSYKIEDKKNPCIRMQGCFYILLTQVIF